MMSETVGSDNGGDGDSKRPWNPKLNNSPLSPVAERALAALYEHDGGISSDKEKGVNPLNSQYEKIPHASLDLSDGCSDIVVPHHPLSEYGDVLSCFLSTPFDRNEMLSLYLSKEGKRAGIQTNNGDHVPILPQKYFTSNNNNSSMKVTHTGMLSQSEINQGSLNEQSKAINDQVTQFLMNECRKIDETEQLTTDNHHWDDGRKPSQDVLPCQSESYEQEILPQHYQRQHDQQQRTYQNQMDTAQHYQHQHDTYQQQMQYYLGRTTQYQSPYYPLQQKMMHPLPMTTNWHPYAAPASAPTSYYNDHGIGMPQPYNSYNNLAFVAAQQRQQQFEHPVQYNETHQRVDNSNSHQGRYQSVSHLKGIDAPIPAIIRREENGGYINSHLPQKAQAATERVPQIIRRENDNDIKSQPQDFVSHPNPKIALANEEIDLVTNREQNSEIDEDLYVTLKDARLVIKSSTPRRSATLIESSEAPPGLPCGWTSKTFKRKSGRTCGHGDKYFYSPKRNIKFRSMKKCYLFIEILKDPNIDGDESAALNEFRRRGHKV